jgi:hypothetical protein
MSTTATPARYYASRADGRYRVIDSQGERTEGTLYVSTHASRAKAEEKAAALNAAEPWGTPEVPPMRECADDTCCGEEAPLLSSADRVAAATAPRPVPMGAAVVAAASPAAAVGTTRTEDGAVVLASGLVEGTPAADAAEAAESARLDAELGITPAAAEEETQAYRIGKVLREWTLATGAPSALVEHITGRNVCYDGTATLRLTAEWAEELSGFATALENAALSGADEVPVAMRAPAVRAARASRTTLGKLFA